MYLKLKSYTSLITAIVLSLILFLTLIYLLVKESYNQNNSARFITQARQRIYSAERIINAIKDHESISKSFVISANPQLLDSIKKSTSKLTGEIDLLQKLTIADGKTELPVIDSIKINAAKFLELMDRVVLLRKQNNMDASIQLLITGQGDLFSKQVNGFARQYQQNQEALIAANKNSTHEQTVNEKKLSAIIILLILIFIIVIFWKELDRVTKRLVKKSNKELESLYRQINQSNDAIYTLDASLKIRSWNKGAVNLYGFTEQEALGQNSNQLLNTGISKEEISDAIEKIAIEDYWTGELKRITKSGTAVYVDASSTTLKDKNGIINGYVGVSRDITLQKTLRDEYTHLVNIVEQSSEAIFSRNIQKQIISWNNGAEKMFGFSKSEAIGKEASKIGFFKLDKNEIINVEKEVSEKGKWESEMTYYRKDGSSFFGAVTANEIKNEKGELTSLYFIVKDISLRKKLEDQLKQSNDELEEKVKARTAEIYKNEQRFRALIENNNDIISLMDKDFKIVYRSPSASRITGWSDEDLINVNGTKNIHPDDLAYAQLIVRELIAHPGKQINTRFRIQHKDGHYLWVEGTVINLLQDECVHAIVFNYSDITERKKLEDLLHKANTVARIGGWEIDLINENVYWTDITREIHETADDYIPNLESGINFYKEEEGKDLIKQKVKGAIEHGKSWDVELKIVTAKNNERWIRIIGETEFVKGKCVKIYGSFQDIDQRKRAAEKLTASEKHFRTLIEYSNEAITLMDESFRLIYRSPAATVITGWTNEELRNLEANSYVHPDDVEETSATFRQVMVNPGKPFTSVFRNLHKEGHYVWIEAILTNWLDDENIKAIVVNFHDITERINAEEKMALQELHFRSIIENISDAIVLNDEYSNILYQSPSVEKILGYSQEERKGRKVNSYIHPDDLSDYNTLYNNLKNTPNIPLHFQYRFLHKDNHYIWLEGVVSNQVANPAVHAYVANYRDITERKETEQQIHDLNSELEEKVIKRTEQLKKSNEDLEAFSYSVSHDLRAPLRAVIGYTSILEEDYSSKLDNEAKRITGVIKSNTIKMGNLIDDLLTFSRMGRNELIKTDVASNRIIDEIINDLDKKNYAEIEWVIQPLPVVRADRNMLKQVWINLISNAVKYSRKNDAPKIEIGAMEETGQIVFYVKDNGVGFDEKYKAKLFKVFQRLHSSEDFEGSGVGLAIIEKIIFKHDGKVWATATLNKGATFYFSLPSKKN
jgi:PAS domain S-box-containing protein